MTQTDFKEGDTVLYEEEEMRVVGVLPNMLALLVDYPTKHKYTLIMWVLKEWVEAER